MRGLRGLPFLATLCAVSIAVAGCGRPYSDPLIQGEQTFPGARDFADDRGRVRVLLTNGMCTGTHLWFDDKPDDGKNTNWVGTRAQQLANAVGDDSFVAQSKYKFAATYPAGATSPAEVQRFDQAITGRDGTIYEVTMLTWGRSIDAARASLDYENATPDEDGNAPVRASFNRTLKTGLLNECLIDVVVYNGTAGDVIRSAMREALCVYIGGRIKGPNNGAAGTRVTCGDLKPAVERANGGNTPVILVPESLGTRVLLDAALALNDEQGGVAISSAFGPIRSIHLASNQIPLLRLADAELTDESALSSVDGQKSRAGLSGGALTSFVNQVAIPSTSSVKFFESGVEKWPGVSVVAYTDPNDPFGYRISEADFVGIEDARLTNVLVSNVDTWFGLFADPLGAHGGTARPQIFEMILNGSDPND